MSPRLRALAGLAGVTLLIVGCNKQSDTSADTPAPGGPAGPARPAPGPNASAKELFDYHCLDCHRVGGQGGPRPGKRGGPDLSKTAADPEHTADWVAEHITNPQTHAPGSRMPKFDGRLTPEQVRKLAEYVLTPKP
ncbi:MAG TPA: cytochrome c, partial [Gemmataceae bacterium]|nr:cytochrome c [Gemmataceae bacterium]